MTVTLHHPHTSNRHAAFRSIMATLVIAAIAVIGIRSVTGSQGATTTRVVDRAQPTFVDPAGLGAALAVTYDTSHAQPTIVDPTGLGAVLAVTYDTSHAQPTFVDPTGLGAALAVTYDTSNVQPTIVDPTGLGAVLAATYDTSSFDG